MSLEYKWGLYGKDNIDGYGNIIYPVDVIDRESYGEYLKVKEKKDKLEGEKIFVSEFGEKIDITTIRVLNGIGLKSLTEEEKERVLVDSKKFFELKGKLLQFLKFSYRHRRANSIIKDELYRRRYELISYFSRYYSINEVLNIVKEEWGVGNISRKHITVFFNSHIEEIKLAQEEYKNSVDEIRLVYKRSRLDELLDLYNDRRVIYMRNKHAHDYRLLLYTLEQIRKEVEGERVTVDGAFKVQMDRRSGVQQEEMMRTIPVKMMILSMVAGRMGIANPNYLMMKLSNSYYAKYTGYSGTVSPYDGTDITFPSELIYNMDELREMAKKRESDELAEMMDGRGFEVEDAEEVHDVRSGLLSELLSQKEEMMREKATFTEDIRVKGEGKKKSLGKDAKKDDKKVE